MAVPTQKGQQLKIDNNTSEDNCLYWESRDERGNCWLQAAFAPFSLSIIGSETPDVLMLQKVLQSAAQLNPNFRHTLSNKIAVTELSFRRDWGLGSSSTLISLVAQWAGVNPYTLLALTFGGSGYDIACATANTPILYQKNSSSLLLDETSVVSRPVEFKPPFASQLYFVHLGRKQNSRLGIAQYQTVAPALRARTAAQIESITRAIVTCSSLSDFEYLLLQHEQLIAQCLQLPTAQSLYFDDYVGVTKSLGAWGGDFVLATAPNSYTDADTLTYFRRKGFETIVRYDDMVKK